VARFSEQLILQVAQATDIVELVSQYVSVKRRGKEFVGLCPFHEDSRPSLTVSPTKQIFKCFACGAGGGVYQWLMMYEKVSFPQAVRSLAARANISLPASAAGERQAEPGLSKDDLVRVASFAAAFYRSCLNAAAGKQALDYALKRGLSGESIKRFGLGYAPDSWDALIRAAATEGIGRSQLLAAGLVSPREGGTGCYDRFRNRLMFPIIDPQGRVIAFGGRALDDGERAKYLNSPESALFDKSRQLYALNWSRERIVSSGQAVIVEGYLDALVPIQAGVDNVVATLGVALTDGHVRLLSRYAREAVLIFDADTAGRAAAERALEIFLAQQIHVRVAAIPAGKDPCDYCLSQGGQALRQLIDDAPDALQYVWQRRQRAWRQAGANLADRARLVEEFLRLVVSSSAYGAIDEVRRGQLAQHIGHLLNVPGMDLQQEMRRLSRRTGRGGGRPAGAGRYAGLPGGALAERQLVEVLLNRPDLIDSATERLDPRDFADEQYRRIAHCLWRRRGNLEDLLASEALADLGPLLTELAEEGRQRGNYEQTLADAVEYMIYRRRQEELQALKKSADNDEALRELTRRLRSGDIRRHPRIR